MVNQSLTIHAKTWCKEISFVVCGVQIGYTYITVKLFSQVNTINNKLTIEIIICFLIVI